MSMMTVCEKWVGSRPNNAPTLFIYFKFLGVGKKKKKQVGTIFSNFTADTGSF